jgi:hypothetical protein
MARRDDREYREYLSEEQRQPGCIVVRMPMELHRGLRLQRKNPHSRAKNIIGLGVTA